MITERQLQFRVGVLVIVAVSVCVGLVVRFGDTHLILKKRYPLTVHLENSGGLYPNAPVTMSGLGIGSVRTIETGINLADGEREYPGRCAREGIRLPVDSSCAIAVTRSLMGDSAIEFVPGRESEQLKPGDRIAGVAAADPLVMIQRLEARTLETLSAFADTGDEWRQVAKNINMLMDTERGHLDQVVERAAESLHEFANTMKTANEMIAAANDQDRGRSGGRSRR